MSGQLVRYDAMCSASAAEGFVYFLGRPSTGSVKIGFSGLPERRLSELQTGSDESLVLLGYVPGPQSLEFKFHRLLAASRLSGEWFAPSEMLTNILAWVAERLRNEANDELRHADALEEWGFRKFGRYAA